MLRCLLFTISARRDLEKTPSFWSVALDSPFDGDGVNSSELIILICRLTERIELNENIPYLDSSAQVRLLPSVANRPQSAHSEEKPLQKIVRHLYLRTKRESRRLPQDQSLAAARVRDETLNVLFMTPCNRIIRYTAASNHAKPSETVAETRTPLSNVISRWSLRIRAAQNSFSLRGRQITVKMLRYNDRSLSETWAGNDGAVDEDEGNLGRRICTTFRAMTGLHRIPRLTDCSSIRELRTDIFATDELKDETFISGKTRIQPTVSAVSTKIPDGINNFEKRNTTFLPQNICIDASNPCGSPE